MVLVLLYLKHYNPLSQVYSLGDDVDVNYMIAVRK